MRTRLVLALSIVVVLRFAASGWANVVFDFEDGTDQGFGHKFDLGPNYDASESFPIVTIGSDKYMEIVRDGDFQEAERASDSTINDAFFQTMLAAATNEAGHVVSYDWYVDTSGGNHGTFLQLGMYISASDGSYTQDFPGIGKDVDLNATQLASGQIFSGTVSETFAAKGFDIPTGQTVYRLGLILHGDGTTVYINNLRIFVPEPASLALSVLACPGLILLARRRRRGMAARQILEKSARTGGR